MRHTKILPEIAFLVLLTGHLASISSPNLGADVIQYEYDAAGRLTRASYNSKNGVSYAYDKAGNLVLNAVVLTTDTDGDGMNDSWEQLHFGSLNRDGTQDLDQDGASDLAEFLGGTNPTMFDSVFRILPTPSVGTFVVVQWHSVSGKTYRVQYKERISDPQWTDLPGDFTATEALSQKADPSAKSSSRFYRVQLVP